MILTANVDFNDLLITTDAVVRNVVALAQAQCTYLTEATAHDSTFSAQETP